MLNKRNQKTQITQHSFHASTPQTKQIMSQPASLITSPIPSPEDASPEDASPDACIPEEASPGPSSSNIDHKICKSRGPRL